MSKPALMLLAILLVLLLVLLLGTQAAVAASWPEMPFPDDARVEPIGEQVRLNGVPMRMHRILSARSPAEITDFYRAALGERRAEERVGDARILSQERNDYFITIRVRPLSATVTEALVSVSDMIAAQQSAGRALGFRLPAGSSVLSDMESSDAGTRSRQLVLVNAHAIDTNRASIERELVARGLQPEGAPVHRSATAQVQFYHGGRGEAQLSLMRVDGQTRVVLTMIDRP